MRRMEASLRKASAVQLRFSQSLANRRQRLSHAMVRSVPDLIRDPALRQHDEALDLI